MYYFARLKPLERRKALNPAGQRQVITVQCTSHAYIVIKIATWPLDEPDRLP